MKKCRMCESPYYRYPQTCRRNHVMITHGEIECPLCAELAKEKESLGLEDLVEELEERLASYGT